MVYWIVKIAIPRTREASLNEEVVKNRDLNAHTDNPFNPDEGFQRLQAFAPFLNVIQVYKIRMK